MYVPKTKSATALARRRDTSCGIHVWHYRRLLLSSTTVVYYRRLLPSFTTVVYHRRFTTVVLPSFTTAVYCHRYMTVSVLLSVC